MKGLFAGFLGQEERTLLQHHNGEGRWDRMAKYNRNSGTQWTAQEVKELERLADQNTPTRVIGLKLGRTEAAVRTKASEENISLKPTNQAPYGSQ